MNRNLIFAVCLFCLTFAVSTARAEEPEQEPTLYLELLWMNDSVPREALLIAPPKKVPLVIVRVLSKDEKLESLAAARGTLTQSTENPDDLLLACSEPRTIWGKAGAEKAVPPNFLITSKFLGAVDFGETLAVSTARAAEPEQDPTLYLELLW
ncbi:MAG: hypothetical protein IJK97_04570, partial [Thermoguttaceae bacterium]|nr:hypothetical protein [Thermoguttaceae bacterium]